jgi:hypothetical protein
MQPDAVQRLDCSNNMRRIKRAALLVGDNGETRRSTFISLYFSPFQASWHSSDRRLGGSHRPGEPRRRR